MIKPSEFIHPEDAAALKQLEGIPGFTILGKKILEYGYEKIFYGKLLASAIRLSPTQLPQIYRYLPPICDMLEMEEPEFYLEMNPIPNAYTFGDTYKFICVTSGLIEMLSSEEITAVLAHECGHILCRHTLYYTMINVLMNEAINNFISKDLAETLSIALYYWRRKSELSCDRVAAVISNPEIVTKVMVRLSGGSKFLTSNINIEEWIVQADEYDKLYNDKGLWNKLINLYNTIPLDHPFAAVRVREIIKWGNSNQYLDAKRQLNLSSLQRCPICGKRKVENYNFCEYCGSRL